MKPMPLEQKVELERVLNLPKKDPNELPDTLGELALLALDDAEIIKRNPLYTIDMETWHAPSATDDVCKVCLAGCVIAQTMQRPRLNEYDPEEFSFDLKHKLFALDNFRCAAFTEAEWYVRCSKTLDPIKCKTGKMPSYDQQKMLVGLHFKAAKTYDPNVGHFGWDNMRNVARELIKHGL